MIQRIGKQDIRLIDPPLTTVKRAAQMLRDAVRDRLARAVEAEDNRV
ncbi:hypothetical protein KIN_20940 [Litoreibacter roseus]|uniref:Uncharacterized protein n=1 Tax=Litoreibacter roseus TaxID=2601869 RepID=A0A6N6JGQ2_9RHOB|nr:hypothetical protein KIN_20940 [Litoreibacter roseus]